MNGKEPNNNYNTTEIEEKAIFNSLGLLEPGEKEMLKTIIKSLPGAEKKIVSDYNNLSALFPQILSGSFKEISPSADVKGKLFKRIKDKQISQAKASFKFIFSDSDDWVPHPEVDGVKVKRLAVNPEKGYLMMLMKAAAGTVYPSHHHSGSEECYVLEGDLYAQGKILGPGDFHHAEGGSDHEQIHTKNGCTLLLVVDPKDY